LARTCSAIACSGLLLSSALAQTVATTNTATFTGGAYATAVTSGGANAVDKIYTVSVNSVPPNSWDTMLWTTNNASALSAGDLLIAEFTLESLIAEPTPGAVEPLAVATVVFEQNSGTFPRSLAHTVHVGRVPQRFRIPFVCADNYAAGAAKLSLRFGARTQQIRVSRFQLLRYTGKSAFNDTLPLTGFTTTGTLAGEAPTTVAVSGQPLFTSAQQYTVTQARETPVIQVRKVIPTAVNAGDLLVLFCYINDADANDGAEAYARLIHDGAESPFSWSNIFFLRSEQAVAPATTPAWRMLAVPMVANLSFAAGKSRIGFNFGPQVQKIQIGGMRLYNLGPATAFEGAGGPTDGQTTLSSTVLYGGRAWNDAWRAAAATRIDSLRRANLAYRITDGAGTVLTNTTVATDMTRHAFSFGSAVTKPIHEGTGADAVRYRSEFAGLFNSAVSDNQMKWTAWWNESAPTYNGWYARKEMGALRDLGIIDIRGHNVIWSRFGTTADGRYLPAKINGVTVDTMTSAQLKIAVGDHITNKVGHNEVKGFISEWDVINEPWANHDVQDKIASSDNVSVRSVEKSWHDQVRTADPGARIAVNDYGIEGAVMNRKHQDDFYEWCRSHKFDHGTPLDVVGMQSHVNWTMPGMGEFKDSLDRFANGLGVRIAITEYDQSIADNTLQAEYLRDYLTMAFSHPAVDSFLVWGFWDAEHWKKNSPIYRRDWSLKPSGAAWLDLVHSRWWSTTPATAAPANHQTRLYKGGHRVTVAQGGTSRGYDTWLTENRTVHIPFVAGIEPLAGVDLGTTPLAGSTTYSSSQSAFVLRGSGVFAGNSGMADSGHFATREIGTSATLTARLTGLASDTTGVTIDSFAKAGVVFRQSLAPNSPLIAVIAMPSNRVVLYVRERPYGPIIAATTLTGVSLPLDLRIVRSGDSFTASYKAAAATTYTQLGQHTLRMGTGLRITGGLTVNSNTGSAVSRATFTNVAVQ
jgi:GH35 family endo-1,4-beta-xylanase